MIEEIVKDITTVEDGVVLHGCNCVGGFGAGVAGAIRKKWPFVYESFKENGIGEHLLGTTEFILRSADIELVVANGYTQVNCGSDGKRYADPVAVESCINAGVEYAAAFDKPIYMPKIGCGLGGLSWEDEVKPIIEKVSLKFPEVNIFICDL